MKNLLLFIVSVSIHAGHAYAQKWESVEDVHGKGVNSLVSSVNGLYAGGFEGVQLWNGTTWTNLGKSSAYADNFELEMHNDTLYMVNDRRPGEFKSSIYRYCNNSWEPVGGKFYQPYMNFLCMYDILSFNGQLVAGGVFTQYEGAPCNNVVTWDGTTWKPLGTDVHGVRHLIEHNGELYAQGNITRVKYSAFPEVDSITYHIGKWDGSKWIPLDPTMTFVNCGQMISFNGDLIIPVFNQDLTYTIARWTGTGYIPMGNGEMHVPAGFAVFNNELYVFGTAMLFPNGNPSNVVMKWNGSSWEMIGAAFNYAITDLEAYNGELYASGHFTKIGNDSVKHVARLNMNPKPNSVAKQNAPRCKVYPNPASDDLTLETTENGTVYLYNQLGQLLGTYSIENPSNQIRTDELGAGVYTLHFETGKGRSTEKFVIRR